MDASTSTKAVTRRGVPLWAQILICALLAGLLAIVAVGLSRTQQGNVQPGAKISDFSLTTFSGYEFQGRSLLKLSDFRGKVVVINFWASWCKPCEQEAAALRQSWEYYQPGGKVVFLGVDYVDTEPEARAYLEKFGIRYPNGPDLGTRVSQLFRIKGVPETYFIDPNGVLRYAQIGPFSSEEDIQAIIDPMLQSQ